MKSMYTCRQKAIEYERGIDQSRSEQETGECRIDAGHGSKKKQKQGD